MDLARRGTKAFCWSWYAKIGVSLCPFGPTASLCFAYVIAMYMQDLAAPTAIDAIHNLPESSLSVTWKNLC